MSREAHPWFSAEKHTYFAYVKRRKIRLLDGQCAETPENEKLAQAKLRQILKGTKHDAAPGALRAADVIERYLKLHQPKYSPRAFEERKRYLQQFAEAHGFRKVNHKDCLPVHVEEWLA